MGKSYQCSICGGKFNTKQNYERHMDQEKEFEKGIEGEDYVVCKICGYRSSRLTIHIIKSHGISQDEYLKMFADSILVAPKLSKSISEKTSKSNIRGVGERKDDRPCEFCGEIVNHRHANIWSHYQVCKQTIKPMKEGYDYLKCPECSEKVLLLGRHLKNFHGWNNDRIAVARNNGLVLEAGATKCRKSTTCRKKYGSDHHLASKQVREKISRTTKEKYGVDNVASLKSIKDKQKETTLKRYGVEHAMQCSEVYTKQVKSAGKGPSKLELFFNEHTCKNVVFTGYGGRYIRVKKSVVKGGKEFRNLIPDFMILNDKLSEEGNRLSQERKPLDSRIFRSKYVIELFGDYYHGESLIGVNKEEHEKQVIEAYDSIGISCLVLWESDVLINWNSIKGKVGDWIRVALDDINSQEVRVVEDKVDKRVASYKANDGSGKAFKTQSGLDKWNSSEKNMYSGDFVEGKDYVECKICGHRQCNPLHDHIRKVHKMDVDHYKSVYDEVLTPESYRVHIGETNKKKQRKKWSRKWEGKVVGVDFIECPLCGYRTACNLSRHLKNEHGILDPEAKGIETKTQKCKDNLSNAAIASWDSRGMATKEPKQSFEEFANRKRVDIPEDVLRGLYEVQGLSDDKIGLMYGISGVAVGLKRKSYGISTRSRKN